MIKIASKNWGLSYKYFGCNLINPGIPSWLDTIPPMPISSVACIQSRTLIRHIQLFLWVPKCCQCYITDQKLRKIWGMWSSCVCPDAWLSCSRIHSQNCSCKEANTVDAAHSLTPMTIKPLPSTRMYSLLASCSISNLVEVKSSCAPQTGTKELL